MSKFLYFAYGSNMLTERLQMPTRSPSAKPIDVAVANGYRLCFSKRSEDGSGKATLEKDGKAAAYGVLFEICVSEREALDKAEGANGKNPGYRSCDAFEVVRHSNDKPLEATTYLATQPEDGLTPYGWYRALVLAGAIQHQLPKSYIEHLWGIPTICDQKGDRATRLEALHVLERAGFQYLASKCW